ncbi:MAG: dihydroneopterin aldolase [Gammaproteobacteria bacterium]|nr:dihydroneopterin aldolase [Gammaproteobacteria bacterium]
MDTIFITDLRADAIIGIYEHERNIKQTVSVDLEMATDVRAAAASDHIDQALNYKAISKRVESYIVHSEFQLVESLAEGIAQVVQAEFGVKWVSVTLHKLGALSNSADVGIKIVRGQLNE